MRPGFGARPSDHVALRHFSGNRRAECRGVATLPVLDTNGRPVGEMQAWNADWSVAEVSVGAGRAADSSESRDRVRRFARDRLAAPPADAFLAELLAAESDY